MNVILEPNGGKHQIEVRPIKLVSIEQVDAYIKYLKVLRRMLWEAKK